MVERPGAAFQGRPLTAREARLNNPLPRVLLAIVAFEPRAGAVGDVITGVNGKPVRRLSDLSEEFEQAGVGKSVQLTVTRNGQTRTVPVEVVDIGRAS